jgi:DNA invertase Pin-like site-specific DNA recombinase
MLAISLGWNSLRNIPKGGRRMNRPYNVGAYVRLSMEGASYDSESVENQREMLSLFITRMPGWIEEKFYIDDGFSGADFNRPAFQEMMSDVRSGLVNLVLVKDLSRFGRNYLETGRYLEEELPALGCRFVSLSEGIDTETGENDIMPFLNAMNDYYLKNLSDRIRVAMAAMARDGQKISGNAPYGYRRDPQQPTRLIVDDYSAGVVRRMFDMRKQGNGYGKIVRVLNTEGILPPLLYYLTENNRVTAANIKTRLWTASTVNKMLRSEVYVGHAVQLVKQVVSYRDKREIKRDPDEHVRVENAFPAIIDQETWDAVQAVNDGAAARFANKRTPEKQLFSGLLVCPDCGKPMICIRSQRQTKKRGLVDYVSYYCQTYSMTGTGCTRHPISEPALKQIVGEQIRQLAERVKLDEGAMLQSLTSRLIGDVADSKADKHKEQRMLKQRIHKLEDMTAKLYEDRVTGVLSEESYSKLAHANEAERLENEKRLALLETSEQERAVKLADIKLWMRLMRKNAGFADLSRDLLDSLIDKIEVGEYEIIDGVRHQDIRVIYKIIGSGICEFPK